MNWKLYQLRKDEERGREEKQAWLA